MVNGSYIRDPKVYIEILKQINLKQQFINNIEDFLLNGVDKIQPVSNLHSGDNTVPYLVVTSWKKTKILKDPYLVPPR